MSLDEPGNRLEAAANVGRVVVGLSLGLGYAVPLFWFAVLCMNRRQGGSVLPLVIFFAPVLPIPGLQWVAAGLLLALGKWQIVRWLLLVHYAAALAIGSVLLWGEFVGGDVVDWPAIAEPACVGLAFYLVGQIAIWWRVGRVGRSVDAAPQNNEMNLTKRDVPL